MIYHHKDGTTEEVIEDNIQDDDKPTSRRKVKIQDKDKAAWWNYIIKNGMTVRYGHEYITFTKPKRKIAFVDSMQEYINIQEKIKSIMEEERCKQTQRDLKKTPLTRLLCLLKQKLWSVCRLVKLPGFLWRKILKS